MKKKLTKPPLILWTAAILVLLMAPAYADGESSLEVTVQPQGAGDVEIDTTDPNFSIGTEVSLEAVPEEGYRFDRWEDTTEGVFSGNQNPIQDQITGDHNVVAHFESIAPTCYTLSTQVLPASAGTVTAPPADEACLGTNRYEEGASIIVSASPNDGYRFSNWSGDLPTGADPSSASLEVLMDRNRSLTAEFVTVCQVLTLSRNNELGGSVPTANPLKRSCPNDLEFKLGESTTLTAFQTEAQKSAWKVVSWKIGNETVPASGSTYDLVMPPLPAGTGLLAQVNYAEKATFGFASAAASVVEAEGMIDLKVVRKTGTLPDAATIQFQTVDGSAKAGEDYTATSGPIEFGNGVNEKTISIPINTPDNIKEPSEFFTVQLSNSDPNSKLGQATIQVEIIDESTPTVRFEEAVYEVNESETSVVITVSVSPLPQSGDVFVDFGTQDGTATAGEDYTAVTDRTLRIATSTGEGRRSVRINLQPDDLDEPDEETVLLMLMRPSANAALAAEPTAEIKIIDDDDPPSVGFSTDAYFIKKEASSQAEIPVELSASSGQIVAIDYSVALEGASTNLLEGTFTFDKGVTNRTLVVPISSATVGDILFLQLSNPLNVELGEFNAANLYVLSTDINDCHALNLTFTGYGQQPGATDKASSLGCPAGQYVDGELVNITAQPENGWYVAAWQGTIDDESTGIQNAVEMPDGPATVNVDYRVPIFFSIVNNPELLFIGPEEDEPNNLFSQANGPLLYGKDYFGGFPSEEDKEDRFYFFVSETAEITITLGEVPAGTDYDIFLFDEEWAQKGAIADSRNFDNLPEEIVMELVPGKYYIRILPGGSPPSSEQYRLRVSD